MTNQIQIEKLDLFYSLAKQRVQILHEINLGVGQGEYLGLIGRSGSGKSSLLNLMTGIERPSKGSIRIEGQEISRLNETGLAKWRGSRIGIVFQFFQLIPSLTVVENLILPMEYAKIIPQGLRKKRALELLGQVGLEDHVKKLPGELSGGEQQRVAIARALANDPAFIFADEPTGNLDSANAQKIHQILKDLVTVHKKTVIVATHEQGLIGQFNRVVELKDGRIISDSRGTVS